VNRKQTQARLIELKIAVDRLPDDDAWNLRGANLIEADLSEANLREADLREADLYDADLYEADLRGADLRGADLRGADLRGANLREANLSGADLYDADLSGADLRGADLRGADLRGANLREATWVPTYQKWAVSWNSGGEVSIGCKTKTIEDWDVWFAGTEEYQTRRNTAEFARIEAAYQHAKRMYEIWKQYKKGESSDQPK